MDECSFGPSCTPFSQEENYLKQCKTGACSAKDFGMDERSATMHRVFRRAAQPQVILVIFDILFFIFFFPSLCILFFFPLLFTFSLLYISLSLCCSNKITIKKNYKWCEKVQFELWVDSCPTLFCFERYFKQQFSDRCFQFLTGNASSVAGTLILRH